MARVASVCVAIAVLAGGGCQAPARGGAVSEQPASTRTARPLPEVPPLALVGQAAEAAVQEIVDSAEPEVQVMACGDLLKREVTLQTSRRTSVAVLMAMLVTQLDAPATVDGNQWTLFCRNAPASGKLFRKGRPAEDVTVPRAAEGPK